MTAIRTFLCVAESGQVTKAAKSLNITQSAASQQIHRLEQMLGIDLLIRTANRVRLSSHGEAIYEHAKALVAMHDELLSSVLSARPIREISFGIPHDLVELIMPRLLKRFVEEIPSVEVKLVSFSTGNLRTMIDSGDLDITLTTELASDSTGDTLFEDRLVWAGAVGGRMTAGPVLFVALGDKTDHFAGPARKALDGSGLTWKVVRQKGDLGSVMAMLAADLAIAPFLACAVPTALREIKADHLPVLPIYNIKLRTHLLTATPEQEALISIVKDYFRDFSHNNQINRF